MRLGGGVGSREEVATGVDTDGIGVGSAVATISNVNAGIVDVGVGRSGAASAITPFVVEMVWPISLTKGVSCRLNKKKMPLVTTLRKSNKSKERIPLGCDMGRGVLQ